MKLRLLLAANQKKELYANAVETCGAIADVKYAPDDNVDYDGLILCGGNDINPSYYNKEINGSINIDDTRDEAEFALLKKFLKTGKPILGICRGYQLLNVALGGTLIQHLETVQAHRKATPPELVHCANAEKGSIFESLYGERFSVNSYHHQGLDKIGNGLRVTMRSDDGLPEAFEHETAPYLGVQWHPERMCLEQKRNDAVDGIKIFEYFLSLCEKYKNKK